MLYDAVRPSAAAVAASTENNNIIFLMRPRDFREQWEMMRATIIQSSGIFRLRNRNRMIRKHVMTRMTRGRHRVFCAFYRGRRTPANAVRTYTKCIQLGDIALSYPAHASRPLCSCMANERTDGNDDTPGRGHRVDIHSFCTFSWKKNTGRKSGGRVSSVRTRRIPSSER